jgi:serine protease DegQ
VVATTNDAGSALLGFSNDLADAVERAGASIVTVHGRSRLPSRGVYWRQGVVVTADHTIDREEGITVTLADGTNVPATLAGRDSGTDLAILKVETSGLPAATVGDSTSLKIGHVVLAVGRPGESGLSASWGAISALGPAFRTWSGGQIDQLVRPDLTLYPGFSGGALIDARGEIVGINTSGLSRSLTLSIPTSTVNRVVDQLLSHGRVSRGYLGVGMQPVRLPDALVASLGLQHAGGLIVVHVENGGPAENAGLLVGDIVLSLGGNQVKDTEDVQAQLDPERVGQPLAVQVVRGGTLKDLSLTVGDRPQRGA